MADRSVGKHNGQRGADSGAHGAGAEATASPRTDWLAQLIPQVYDELRRLAAKYLDDETATHTLQPTALVHEALVRLAGQRNLTEAGRATFLAAAARTMRRVLVDHARAKRRLKRGGGVVKLSIEAAASANNDDAIDVVALDDALERLAAINPDYGRVVELRFFAGLSNEEAAAVLGMAPSTCCARWQTARAWLRRELGPQ